MATPPGGTVSQEPIALDQLLSGARPTGLTTNQQLAPGEGETEAPPFEGTLHLAGTTMGVISDAPDGRLSTPVRGKDTTYFPDVDLSFFTDRGQLVPVTQDVIRNGVLPPTRSYWDLIVQPGRVWSQPGDDGWHRASFPFALVNSIEGGSHTGIGLFAYRGSQVSALRFQIVSMTAPYDVTECFSAWGAAPASYSPGVEGIEDLRELHRRSEAARLPVRPWSDLTQYADPSTLDAFASYSDVVGAAVVLDGTLYRDDFPTAAGPFPYSDTLRWGVWSVTKAAMLNVALLRLAQKYGDSIMDAPIARYVAAARQPGWDDVTFSDLANMASGHGPADDPTTYLADYARWYLAPSAAEKTAAALDYPRFAEPGTVCNYRDQDAYLLGVAAEALLEEKEGDDADLITMLRDQVYRPIGIHHVPTNTTIEPGAHSPYDHGHPMLAYGYYPTFDDLAKIAALYQDHGACGDHQILSRALVDRLLSRPRPAPQALPSTNGSHYLMGWRIERVTSYAGCTRWVPQMKGWGGNTVTVLPGGVTLIRMRNNAGDDPSDPQVVINALADQLSPLCGGALT
jgi:hypothetical protein